MTHAGRTLQEYVLQSLGEGQAVHETPRTILRRVTTQEVAEYFGTPLSPQDLFSLTRTFLINRYARVLPAELKGRKGMRIGEITFLDQDKNGTVHFGIDIKESFQGQGYGPELVQAGIDYACRAYADCIDRLLLLVDVTNARAIHVYEKAGYRTVEVRRRTNAQGRKERALLDVGGALTRGFLQEA